MSHHSESPARAAAKSGGQRDVKSPSKPCKLKSGAIAIVPVRYALDDVDETTGQPKNPLPGTESWHPPFKVKHSFYTLRQLRDGWLYVYSEQNQTLHEYQVSGADLIKYDWGANAADQPADDRGTPGVSATYIKHSIKETIYLAFAHQRWTWRICEQMRSDVTARNQWMRRLSLGHYHATMEHQHTADISLLGERVADISSATQSVPLDAFSGTCTPLSPRYMPDDGSTHVEGQLKRDVDNGLSGQSLSAQSSEWHAPLKAEGNNNLVAVKSPNAEDVYKADLDQQSALFVALDDVLADTSDSFLLLSHEWLNKEAIIGDERNSQKLQMATIARNLGRVILPEREIPEKAKVSISSRIQFENDLTDYVDYTNHINNKIIRGEKYSYWSVIPPSQQYSNELGKLKQNFAEKWGYTPHTDLYSQYRNVYKYEDEVRWKDLDNFLIKYGEKINKINQNITIRHSEFLDIMTQLGIETERFGIDTQYANGQKYLYSLFLQILIGVTQSASNEDSVKLLSKKLSLNSQDNLLSLSSFGFSIGLLKSINAQTNENLSLKSTGDNVKLFLERLNEWNDLNKCKEITEQGWYKKLLKPLQDTINAIRMIASTKNIQHVIENVIDILMPYQWQDGNIGESLLQNLRHLIIRSVVHDTPIYIKDSKIVAQRLEKLESSVRTLRRNMIEYIENRQKKGKEIKKEKIKEFQDKIHNKNVEQAMLEVEVIVPINEESFNQAKNRIKNYLEQKVDVFGGRARGAWKKIGKLDGLIAALTVWNLGYAITHLSENFKKDKSPYHEEVFKQVASAFFWSISAIASIFKSKALDSLNIADKELLKYSLTEIYQQGIKLTNKSVGRMLMSVRVLAFFGFIAASIDSYHLKKSINDELESPLARTGYFMQFISAGIQGSVFSAKLLASIFRVGTLAVLAEEAWLTMLLSLGGVLLVIGLVLVSVFSKSKIERWLEQSLWGNKPNKNWSMEQCLREFFKIIYEPEVSLKRLSYYVPAKMVYDPKLKKFVPRAATLPKWQLTVTINTPMVVASSIGLKVMYKAPKHRSYLINESKGTWKKQPKKAVEEYILDFEGAPGYGYQIGICLGMMLHSFGSNEYMYYYGEISDGAIGEHKIDMNYSRNVSENSSELVKIASENVPSKPLIFKLDTRKESEIKSNIPMRSI